MILFLDNIIKCDGCEKDINGIVFVCPHCVHFYLCQECAKNPRRSKPCNDSHKLDVSPHHNYIDFCDSQFYEYMRSDLEFGIFDPKMRCQMKSLDLGAIYLRCPISFYIMILYIKHHIVQKMETKQIPLNNFNEVVDSCPEDSMFWKFEHAYPHINRQIRSYLINDTPDKFQAKLEAQKFHLEVIKRFIFRAELAKYPLDLKGPHKRSAHSKRKLDFKFKKRLVTEWKFEDCLEIMRDADYGDVPMLADYYFGSGKMTNCWERYPELADILNPDDVTNLDNYINFFSDDDNVVVGPQLVYRYLLEYDIKSN